MKISDPLERAELTFLLGIAFQAVLGEFVSRLTKAGYADLRPMHGMVFQALGGAGMTSTELAEVLGMTKQATGQIVKDLEERGYVVRQDHPDGGRRRLVRLTDKAYAHLRTAGLLLHDLEAEIADGVAEEDLHELRHELVKLIRHLLPAGIPPLRPSW